MNESDVGEKPLTFQYPDSELVFGIVCAVGTDYRSVVDYMSDLLRLAHYTVSEQHISDSFQEIADSLGLKLNFPAPDAADEYERIDAGMRAGNEIRKESGRADFLALDVASRILSLRENSDAQPCGSCGRCEEPEALPSKAHIVISLKREEEVETLRKIYGPGFFLIGIFSSERERRNYLETRKGVSEPRISSLIKRDEEEEELPNGQRTRKTFQHADVFVALKDAQYKNEILRFMELVFGRPYSTPTKDEYGMFLASSASARSGALARQVGAAVLSKRGDPLALGCNDVPAAGGGLYWEGGPEDHREYEKGVDSNDLQKKHIVDSAVKKFEDLTKAESWHTEAANALRKAVSRAIGDGQDLDDRQKQIVEAAARNFAQLAGAESWRTEAGKSLETALSNAIAGITEFGRTVHAEMDAITTCARIGVPIRGTTLFTTLFPCHSCTRHIIATGIRRVVYIEPYPKSQAGQLHGDEICLGACEKNCPICFKDVAGKRTSKIPFEPFVGIAPRRFIDLFSLTLSAGYRVERKRGGKVIGWQWSTSAHPRVPMAPTSYIQREQIGLREIKRIYARKEEQHGRPGTAS